MLPTGAFAATEPAMKSEVLDTEKIPSKAFTPQSLSPDVRAAAPYWEAQSGQYTLGGTWTMSDSYTSSSMSSKKSINRIYAKTKHYVDGGLRGSSSDNQYNANHAGANVNKGQWLVGDDEVYGEHAFEHNGFQSWYPETYAT